ncbi:RNA binding [Blomia tropicalis]|nr:RNA binding [Blomia tropicalis]
MANQLNRTLIACSVSALALAIVTLYYWQLRKRRKLSDADNIEGDSTNQSLPQDNQQQGDNIVVKNIQENHFQPPKQTEFKSLVNLGKEGAILPIIDNIEKDNNQKAGNPLKDNGTSVEKTERDNNTELSETVEETISVQLDESNELEKSLKKTVKINLPPNFEKEFCEPLIKSILYHSDTATVHNQIENPIPFDCNESRLEETDTMRLKSNENHSPPFSKSTSNCNDNMEIVGQLKHRLTLSEESTVAYNHLKISSIDFENDSKSTNSILTIEVVKPIEKATDDANIDAIKPDIVPNDNGNQQQLLSSNNGNDGSTSTAADMKLNEKINDDTVDGVDAGANCASSNDSGDKSLASSTDNNDKQKGHLHPKTSASVNVTTVKPKRISSNNVKPGQTFAQVLLVKSNSNKEKDNETKKKTMPVNSHESFDDHANEETDMYNNYPDSTVISDGQYSPNSEVGECSDIRSLDSNDSGKGSSDIHHAESAAVVVEQSPLSSYQIVNDSDNQPICYQFVIPTYLCGKLIGAGGHFINSVKDKSNTQIVVSGAHHSEFKICSITGTMPNIKIALNQIRRRFPINDYPTVTLNQVNLINPVPTIPLSQSCQLHLLPDIVTEVILSCTINAGHFFLQQPTHPSYTTLNQLDAVMRAHYSQDTEAPPMPQVYSGLICAAPTAEGWYRAMIRVVNESHTECDIMFVDYGGYGHNVPVSSLRQIRYDFMSLPFQASECFLANVMPIDAENGWSIEANNLFEEMARGQIIYSVMNGYDVTGVPLVDLFKLEDSTRVYFNKELVKNGHAVWIADR